MTCFKDLKSFVHHLEEKKDLTTIDCEVDPYLELAEIHRRVVSEGGPALKFTQVKNSSFPVVSNLFGTKERSLLAFGKDAPENIERLVKLATEEFPPTLKKLWENRSPILNCLKIGTKKRCSSPLDHSMKSVDLEKIPLITSWPKDGGPFITLPLVYTEPPGGGPSNLGMYRIQRFNSKETGLHFQIGKGGGYHLHEHEVKNERMPVTIYIGAPPAFILSAIAPLPEKVPEILLASFMMQEKLSFTRHKDHPHPLFSSCEFALQGYAEPHERRLEGPFGDHYGFYSLAHDFPVFKCTKIHHRKDAIFPVTVVGKPPQDDLFIGNYLQELLKPLVKLVMPNVTDLWSYGETGFHALTAAVIKERFDREVMSGVFRILGEGQLSLTKFLLVTDTPQNLKNFKTLLKHILERFSPEKDLYIFSHLSLDTLDYTGPELNKGSRGVMLGVGKPIRALASSFSGKLPSIFSKAKLFCPGCLVISGPSHDEITCLEKSLSAFKPEGIPLVIISDNADESCKSEQDFLWNTFMRFEPADIFSSSPSIKHNHISHSTPIMIDARQKKRYPDPVEVDEETRKKVDRRWREYFPNECHYTGIDVSSS